MGHALENTIESVEKAINLKVDGIEIDVFKSKSGELIVYHDPSLGRLSNSTAFIEQISLDSIKKVDDLCSVIFSAAFTFLIMYVYTGLLASVYLLVFNLLSKYIPSYILLIPLGLLVTFFLLHGCALHLDIILWKLSR